MNLHNYSYLIGGEHFISVARPEDAFAAYIKQRFLEYALLPEDMAAIIRHQMNVVPAQMDSTNHDFFYEYYTEASAWYAAGFTAAEAAACINIVGNVTAAKRLRALGITDYTVHVSYPHEIADNYGDEYGYLIALAADDPPSDAFIQECYAECKTEWQPTHVLCKTNKYEDGTWGDPYCVEAQLLHGHFLYTVSRWRRNLSPEWVIADGVVQPTDTSKTNCCFAMCAPILESIHLYDEVDAIRKRLIREGR
jgi:hypothetical protein